MRKSSPPWGLRLRPFPWPAVRQFLERDPAGLGRAAMSPRSRTLAPRTAAADKIVPSVCPYCGVGCAQLVYVRDGRLTDIEGDAASPLSAGCLCPRGAATFQLVTGDHRQPQVLYRRPYGRRWETLRLEEAMEMVAERVKRTRDATWEEASAGGKPLRRTLGISCVAGGTLDNEENYLIRKLFTGGLGMVQAGVRSALPFGAGYRFDGGATTFLQDLMHSDCILIGGSNMAECHPVGFRWVMAAKRRGATVIHLDPRFTRTSAVADLHVPIRTGTDIAFLGGIIRYIVENRRHFHDYLVHYTNAAAIVADEYRDAEDLDGLFSGWDPATGRYDRTSWGYQGAGVPGAAGGDPTLQHPRCVFQVVRRHYNRYTPALVEAVCGVPQDLFLRIAETLCTNSGRERTGAFCGGAGWTQHTVGAQVVRAATIIQLLLGNLGRPGGGLLILAGHASSRGAADVGGASNHLPGYLPMPTDDTPTLANYLRKDWPGWEAGELPKKIVSLLRAWYGEAANEGNGWCFDCLPLLTGDHSPAAVMAAMAAGAVKGHFVIGANPAVGSLNGPLQRKGLRQLDWLVVRDLAPTETAEFWCQAPEIDAGEVGPEEIATEVFFFPAAAHTEKDGSFTNTQRLVQWHHAAVPSPGDARSDLYFIYDLGKRLQALYDGSTLPRDRPIRTLVWDYPVQGEREEPVAEAVLFEIGGFTVSGREPLPGGAALQEDGSTACGCWLYTGCCADGVNQPANRRPAAEQSRVAPDWGWAWPVNRRLLGNRAAADPEGRPWSERKKYVWRDAATGGWTGFDVPDIPGMGEGEDTPVASLFDARSMDGPLPTHYEPQESVVKNLLYGQQCNPARVEWRREDNPYHRGWDDPRFPCVLTTCRLAEHHASGGMSRWLTWLCELQPAMFCEVSPQLAAEKGLENGDWATIVTARAEIEARVLVTPRLQPLVVGGRIVHQIALPSHWGRCGRSQGDSANDLIALTAGPGTGSEASKALTGNIRPGRRRRGRWAAFGHPPAGAPLPGGPRDLPIVDGSKPADRHGRRGEREQET